MTAYRSRAVKARQHVQSCLMRITVRTKRWIEVDGAFAIGECGGELLKAVADHGSLASGARQVGWSYRHAWGYLRHAERVLGVPLLAPKSGKGAARGSVLTHEARAVLATLLSENGRSTVQGHRVGDHETQR